MSKTKHFWFLKKHFSDQFLKESFLISVKKISIINKEPFYSTLFLPFHQETLLRENENMYEFIS